MTTFWSPGPFLVAGPCALEHDELNAEVAGQLADLSVRLGIRAIFKGSFDKANRSRAGSPRGIGFERGLEALAAVRAEFNLPVLTDVHDVAQVDAVSRVVDAIQIPAFLCRQTDLLQAVGATGLPVNIKKGQWMDVPGMVDAVAKIRAAGSTDVCVTERGTFFGYGDLVVDVRNVVRLKASGAAVMIDATHAVQRPNAGPAGTTGGDRDFVPTVLMAGAATGVDGFFIETHPDPAAAPSDAATMWPLHDLAPLVERAVNVWHAAQTETKVPR